jgi:hypothetical protein
MTSLHRVETVVASVVGHHAHRSALALWRRRRRRRSSLHGGVCSRKIA